MAKKNKRKTSFLRKLYEKLNPSAPTEPDDPGEDVSVVEDQNIDPEKKAEQEQQEQDPSAVNSVIFALFFFFLLRYFLE